MVEDTLLSALLSVCEVSGDFTVICRCDGLSRVFRGVRRFFSDAGPEREL